AGIIAQIEDVAARMPRLKPLNSRTGGISDVWCELNNADISDSPTLGRQQFRDDGVQWRITRNEPNMELSISAAVQKSDAGWKPNLTKELLVIQLTSGPAINCHDYIPGVESGNYGGRAGERGDDAGFAGTGNYINGKLHQAGADDLSFTLTPDGGK